MDKHLKIKNRTTNHKKEIPLSAVVGSVAIILLIIVGIMREQNEEMSLFQTYILFAGVSTLITAYSLHRSDKFQDAYEAKENARNAAKEALVVPIAKGLTIDLNKVSYANSEHDMAEELRVSTVEIETEKKKKTMVLEQATA